MLCGGVGLAAGKRQVPVVDSASTGRAPPSRDREGTHPGRISCVWNVETPSGSGPMVRSADCEEGSTPRREQDDPRSECWWAERPRETRTIDRLLRRLCWITGRIPGSYPGSKER
jgi:hypothetical protein